MQIYNPPLIKGMFFGFFISFFEFDSVFDLSSFSDSVNNDNFFGGLLFISFNKRQLLTNCFKT